MADQKSVANKTRASKPKVKTGCTTCKARHIKCDERKPICVQCSNARRECTWQRLGQQLPITRRLNTPLIPNPDILRGGDPERHCFHFFRTKTILQLSGFFCSNFWNYEVLQACISEPAVWHAAVALGSLHQQARLGSPGSNGANLSHFTIQQYTQAVGILSKSSSAQVQHLPDHTLICCVLFTCFESLRGHRSAALMHLKCGLNLISAQNPAYIIPRTPLTTIQCISHILTRLELQTTQFLSHQQTFLCPAMVNKAREICLQVPRTFNNVEAARCASDYLWMYMLYSFEKPTAHSVLETFGNTGGVKLQQCSQLLHQWSMAFERFLEKLRSKLNITDMQAVNVMRINQLIASLSLTTEGTQDSQDIAEQKFSEVISLATTIIDTPVHGDLEDNEIMFSMDTSVVGPLYHVALKCKHGILRRKAIALLRLRKRVEGLWDSRFLADIAEKVVEVEEGRFGEGITDLKVVFNFEEKKAEVQFVCLDEDIEQSKREQVDYLER